MFGIFSEREVRGRGKLWAKQGWAGIYVEMQDALCGYVNEARDFFENFAIST